MDQVEPGADMDRTQSRREPGQARRIAVAAFPLTVFVIGALAVDYVRLPTRQDTIRRGGMAAAPVPPFQDDRSLLEIAQKMTEEGARLSRERLAAAPPAEPLRPSATAPSSRDAAPAGAEPAAPPAAAAPEPLASVAARELVHAVASDAAVPLGIRLGAGAGSGAYAVLSGLPQDAALSHGINSGPGVWLIDAAELDQLALRLRAAAPVRLVLGIVLMAADGRMIGGDAITLDVRDGPGAALAAAPPATSSAPAAPDLGPQPRIVVPVAPGYPPALPRLEARAAALVEAPTPPVRALEATPSAASQAPAPIAAAAAPSEPTAPPAAAQVAAAPASAPAPASPPATPEPAVRPTAKPANGARDERDAGGRLAPPTAPAAVTPPPVADSGTASVAPARPMFAAVPTPEAAAPAALPAPAAPAPPAPALRQELSALPAPTAGPQPRSAIRVGLGRDVKLTNGSETRLPIDVTPPSGVPSGAYLVLRGLPRETSLSKGVPMGADMWRLAVGDLTELRISLPSVLPARITLGAQLLTIDGRLLAEDRVVYAGDAPRAAAPDPAAPKEIKATAAIAATPAPASAERSPAPSSPGKETVIDAVAAAALSRGRRMLEIGNVAVGRPLLERAAASGSAEAAMLLGSSYDPQWLRNAGAVGITPEPAKARKWYEEARRLGARDADRLIAGLEGR